MKQRNGKTPAMVSESNDDLYYALPGLVYARSLEGTDGGYAVMVRRGNTELLVRMNAALAELESDGTLPNLRKNWFGTSEMLIA